MTTNQPTEPETTQRLIAQYLDGSISAEDLQQLEANLAASPESRKLLRDAANIEEGLADWALVESERPADSVDQQRTRRGNNTNSAIGRFGWLAIAASLLFALFTANPFDLLNRNPPSAMTDAPDLIHTEIVQATASDTPQHNYVAYVIDKVDAKFDGLPFDDISDLEKGEYSLLQGHVHLRFKNGATMLLSAPAKFAIENANCFRLYDGQLRALVPRSNTEFCVSSPGVDFHELGSEFGIRANASERVSEINVFQGEVRSKLTGRDEVVQALVSGQAAVYRNGIVEFAKASSTDFIEPGAIGFKRWQSNYVRLQNEPELIGYFPFLQNEPGQVHNFVQHPQLCEFEKMPDGRIGSATWVTGRWPGKRAVMFENPKDYIEFDFPGQYDELTIATWLKLDRVSNTYNAILNSNGWSPGSVHFQLDRFRSPWITTHNSDSTDMSGKLPLGEWIHLAATISKSTLMGETYLNGKLISTTILPKNTIIRPGQCRLGNWFKPSEPEINRALSGRIDELMIWKKRLSAGKIQELYREGLPKTDLNFVNQSIDNARLP